MDITRINGVAFGSAERCNDSGGGIVGGQVGYRWQAGTWVFGLEAQGDWANLRNERISLSTRRTPGNPTSMAWGFTGQVGYAWNATLLYVKGSAAVATSVRYLRHRARHRHCAGGTDPLGRRDRCRP